MLTSQRATLRTTFILTLIAISVGLVACLSNRSTFAPLLNQGVVPISDENPFTGANLFLAKEMEQSVYLYNFLRQRGAPQGIELKGSNEDNLEAHLYYTANREEYIAKPAPRKRSRAKDSGREWIIIGPFELDRNSYHNVMRLAGTSGGVFEIFGKREFLGDSPKAPSQRELKPVFIPTPRPRKSANQPRGDRSDTPSGQPLNFDQQALKELGKGKP